MLPQKAKFVPVASLKMNLAIMFLKALPLLDERVLDVVLRN